LSALLASEEIYKFISQLDYATGDQFCWKSGGDGDNGEPLMYLLDSYFSAKDLRGVADVVRKEHAQIRKDRKWVIFQRLCVESGLGAQPCST